MLKLISLILVLSGNAGFGARTLYIPPYDSYSSGGDVTGVTVGNHVGLLVNYTIQLRNISDRDQSGFLKVLSGFSAGGSIWANAPTNTVNTAFYVRFYMCGDGPTPFAAQNANHTPTNFNSGTMVTWTVPARSIRSVSVGAYFDAIRNTETSFSVSLAPALQLEVTQDPGAILGTVTPAYLAASTGRLCNGTAVPTPVNFPSFAGTNTPISGTPVFLNGGRAF